MLALPIFSKRNHIIKKALQKTVSEFVCSTPKIYEHFFYGAVDIDPQNLAIWYLFETNEDLEIAKISGLCNKIQETTIKNLILLGYPQEAIKISHNNYPIAKNTSQSDTKEYIRKFMPYSIISFTTKEDIINKANGDYHIYIK